MCTLQEVALYLQEHAHLRNTVERIAEYKPNVLLVEKSVARYAQELLLQKGISLVLNVKRSSLLRLARCTEAQVSICNTGQGSVASSLIISPLMSIA